MSEDTDERMERASRIRQMREGQRPDAAEDDEAAERDSDETSSDESESGEDSPITSDGGANDASDSTADEQSPDASPTDPSADDAADEDSAAAGDVDDEATTAAQRAAQAAASVSGGGAEATSDGPAGVGAAAGAASADDESAVSASAAPMQGPTGVELPDEESIQAAIAEAESDADSPETAAPTTARGVDAQDATAAEDTVRVLEFTLGDEHYCLDIAHVEEIVKRESVTRVPNTPAYVEGVVDLRGQITTILDPKLLLDIDQEGSESLLVVFAPEEFEDQGAIGWLVDEVRQVSPIAKSEVSSAPVDADYIEGVIDREDEEFVIWTNPEKAIKLATGELETDD